MYVHLGPSMGDWFVKLSQIVVQGCDDLIQISKLGTCIKYPFHTVRLRLATDEGAQQAGGHTPTATRP